MRKAQHTNPGGSVVLIYIGDDARIGNGAHIGDDAHIGNGARIGDFARIGKGDDTLYPVCITLLCDECCGWQVTMTAHNMQIGCEFHPLKDWWAFDDARIARMDRLAPRWWRRFKPVLVAIAQSRGWPTPKGMEAKDG